MKKKISGWGRWAEPAEEVESAAVAGGGMIWRGVIGCSNGSEEAPRGIPIQMCTVE